MREVFSTQNDNKLTTYQKQILFRQADGVVGGKTIICFLFAIKATSISRIYFAKIPLFKEMNIKVYSPCILVLLTWLPTIKPLVFIITIILISIIIVYRHPLCNFLIIFQ